ncbi:putative NEK kinase [Cyclospora cayetanensis]|uniref:NEK kinase n=1 Tax=Cyclospora cayetanensis TaxID=88456 RepID=A0A1D3D0M3_9EIME|nr:putative NEK kinase [Cyclospora cayetanensis]
MCVENRSNAVAAAEAIVSELPLVRSLLQLLNAERMACSSAALNPSEDLLLWCIDTQAATRAALAAFSTAAVQGDGGSREQHQQRHALACEWHAKLQTLQRLATSQLTALHASQHQHQQPQQQGELQHSPLSSSPYQGITSTTITSAGVEAGSAIASGFAIAITLEQQYASLARSIQSRSIAAARALEELCSDAEVFVHLTILREQLIQEFVVDDMKHFVHLVAEKRRLLLQALGFSRQHVQDQLQQQIPVLQRLAAMEDALCRGCSISKASWLHTAAAAGAAVDYVIADILHDMTASIRLARKQCDTLLLQTQKRECFLHQDDGVLSRQQRRHRRCTTPALPFAAASPPLPPPAAAESAYPFLPSLLTFSPLCCFVPQQQLQQRAYPHCPWPLDSRRRYSSPSRMWWLASATHAAAAEGVCCSSTRQYAAAAGDFWPDSCWEQQERQRQVLVHAQHLKHLTCQQPTSPPLTTHLQQQLERQHQQTAQQMSLRAGEQREHRQQPLPLLPEQHAMRMGAFPDLEALSLPPNCMQEQQQSLHHGQQPLQQPLLLQQQTLLPQPY